MKTALRLTLAGLLLASALPAQADVFSSQNFSGGTTTLDNLPGVNLDAAPGYGGGAGNCEETSVSFSARDGHSPRRATTCRFGNFSVTTSGSSAQLPQYDTTYGGNPPPWQQGWRP